MDRWRSKGRPAFIAEDSLLPPTRRLAATGNSCPSPPPPPLLDKRRSKKWFPHRIDGFIRKVTSYLDAQTSSSSLEDLANRPRRRARSKKTSKSRSASYADYADSWQSQRPAFASASDYLRTAEDLANANYKPGAGPAMTTTLSRLEVPDAGRHSSSHQSRSSDGSVEGRRMRCRDGIKARVEARRDRLRDSSLDESSNDEQMLIQQQRPGAPPEAQLANKRRSRASRTERYLKRMCNGAANGNASRGADHSRARQDETFRPIEPSSAHKYNSPQAAEPSARGPPLPPGPGPTANGNAAASYPPLHCDNDLANDNYYGRRADIGINPLVQQTLQYFSEFDRSMAAQHKARKTYPGHHDQQQHRRPANKPQQSLMANLPQQTPPKPPSRDHRSRIFDNPDSLDKYQQMLKYVPRAQDDLLDKENVSYAQRTKAQSPNTEVRTINEGRYGISPNASLQKIQQPSLSPARSPLRDSYNTHSAIGSSSSSNNKRDRSKSSPLERSDRSPPYFAPISRAGENGRQQAAATEPTQACRRAESAERSSERRSSRNLEEALNELEAIYNSLQLGDEELLERAERRTMEEFHYRGLTATSPDDAASRRRTWADMAVENEPDVPDRLKDDMAYRRMHPKERPSSVDGQSSLSSISYLMTSPVPSRRDMCYIDPRHKPRRKEPDVTLDDVVFRSMHYANNTLKIVEPQPPFGIPLGPITTAVESDYLHTNPVYSPRSRSPYIPSCEPDIVTDDLAFRNLRKDAQPTSRQASPGFTSPVSPSPPSPLALASARRKRTAKSLSANLYGLINRVPPPLTAPDSETSPLDSTYGEDAFNDARIIGRRISDPEIVAWHRPARSAFNPRGQNRLDVSSDVELSSRSYDESSDERIGPRTSSIILEKDADYRTGSDRGSSYLSSGCSSPPPPPPPPSSSIPGSREAVQPVTEQEISVYKKLCQDLENLVQLTKGIDATPSKPIGSKFSGSPSSPADTSAYDAPSSSVRSTLSEASQKRTKPSVEALIDEVEREIAASESLPLMQPGKHELRDSPIKREITTILDSLSCLGNREDARPEQTASLGAATDSRSFRDVTKDICDLTARSAEEESPEKKPMPSPGRSGRTLTVNEPAPRKDDKEQSVEEEKEEETEGDERKHALDDGFFRNLELAKRNGDWKESTPNESVPYARRRTSLAEAAGGTGSNGHQQQQHQHHHHWEGEIRSCERNVRMVCNNASHDMSRLTAKYICYITNHVTAQFCLLLVFFLALLLAIATVP